MQKIRAILASYRGRVGHLYAIRGNTRPRFLFALLLALSSCIQPQPAPRSAPPSDRGSIFLPIIARPVPPSPLPTPTVDPVASCFDNPKALAFYRLLIADPRQQRPLLTCFPALVASAKARAMGLASVDPWAHVDKDGVWPNEYARRFGCRLPVSYAIRRNNVESLAAGSPDTTVILNALTGSNAHSDHLFGRGKFFGAQRHIGIGYAEVPGSQFTHYWVIHIALCEGVSSGE